MNIISPTEQAINTLSVDVAVPTGVACNSGEDTALDERSLLFGVFSVCRGGLLSVAVDQECFNPGRALEALFLKRFRIAQKNIYPFILERIVSY